MRYPEMLGNRLPHDLKGPPMPAILTHDFFGRDAADTVSSQVNLMSKDAHDAFLLGNQGPDPLFYLIIDPRISKQSRVGDLMHHARPAKLLLALRDALSMLTRAERPVGEAYAAGFLCHYLLDSAMHPLVFANEYALCDAGIENLDRSDGSVVHAEIERELDEMVLYEKLHETVASYRPYRKVLRASDATLAIIDKLYFYMNLWAYSRTLELDTYTHAVKSFRVLQRMFYSPKGRLAGALGVADRTFRHTRYSLLRGVRLCQQGPQRVDQPLHRRHLNRELLGPLRGGAGPRLRRRGPVLLGGL